MHTFFQPRVPKRRKTTASAAAANSNDNDNPPPPFQLSDWQTRTDDQAFAVPKKDATIDTASSSSSSDTPNTNNNTSLIDPIHPTPQQGRQGHWKLHDKSCLIRFPQQHTQGDTRTKIAALDMDGTLLEWQTRFPSQHHQIELWNTEVVSKLRNLYDDENYKLVIVSNQGGIKQAFDGKRATFAKSLVDWIEGIVNRPIYASLSTSKTNGYHKPSPKLWKDIIQQRFCRPNKSSPGEEVVVIDTSQSLFVGDSVETEDDPQGGVDQQFARNVGHLMDTTLPFYTPTEFFGPSHQAQRREQKQSSQLLTTYEPPPAAALAARRDLISGNLQGPIMLILVGVQGSGKSYFCQALLDAVAQQHQQSPLLDESPQPWVHLSQDVLKRREKVEAAAKQALQQGQSVVLDRMHLDPPQRAYFLEIAQSLGIPAHCLVLSAPSTEILQQRVRQRTNHAIMGTKGAAMAVASLDKLVMPHYKEGLALISATNTPANVDRFAQLYARVGGVTKTQNETENSVTTVSAGTSGLPITSQFTLGQQQRELSMPVLEKLSTFQIMSYLSTHQSTRSNRATGTSERFNLA